MIPIFFERTYGHSFESGFLEDYLTRVTVTQNKYNVARMLYELATSQETTPDNRRRIMMYLDNKKIMDKTILTVDLSYFNLTGLVNESESGFSLHSSGQQWTMPTFEETMEYWAKEGTLIAIGVVFSRVWQRHCHNSTNAKERREHRSSIRGY